MKSSAIVRVSTLSVNLKLRRRKDLMLFFIKEVRIIFQEIIITAAKLFTKEDEEGAIYLIC